MTRQDVIDELKDICAVIPEDGELVAEDSLDALASKLMEEGSEDISEEELDAINEMIYDSFVEPETICNELVNMLMSGGIKVEDIDNPLTADIWDDDDYYADLTPDEVAALTTDVNSDVNYSEFSDHHYQQEGCEGGDCKEVEKELNEDIKTTPVAPELENKIKQLLGKYSNNIKVVNREDRDGITIDSVLKTPWHVEDPDETPHDEMVDVLKKNGFEVLIDTAGQAGSTWHSFIDIKEDLKEGYYGKDSLIAGDIPGKENCFHELISMRFHNMGYDEDSYPLMPGSQSQMWNPFGQYGIVMYGPDEAFFDNIVAYIETEVSREDSAWYNRDYEVCQVEGREATDKGPWALCIECMPYDMDDVDLLPRKIKDEYARRRKLRRGSKAVA